MNAEEWKFWIWHRIDQVADQVLPFFFDDIIFTTKWDDFGRRLLPGNLYQPVGVQPAAGDDELGLKSTGGGFNRPTGRTWDKFFHACIRPNFTTGQPDEFAQFFADGGIIHDALLRHMDGCEAGGMWLNLP